MCTPPRSWGWSPCACCCCAWQVYADNSGGVWPSSRHARCYAVTTFRRTASIRRLADAGPKPLNNQRVQRLGLSTCRRATGKRTAVERQCSLRSKHVSMRTMDGRTSLRLEMDWLWRRMGERRREAHQPKAEDNQTFGLPIYRPRFIDTQSTSQGQFTKAEFVYRRSVRFARLARMLLFCRIWIQARIVARASWAVPGVCV